MCSVLKICLRIDPLNESHWQIIRELDRRLLFTTRSWKFSGEEIKIIYHAIIRSPTLIDELERSYPQLEMAMSKL